MAKAKLSTDQIIDEALALVEDSGWSALTLAALAERLSCSISEVHALCPDRAAIWLAFVDQVDRSMLTELEPFEDNDSAKDRLFAVVMARFDALEGRKGALKAVYKGLLSDPAAALCGVARATKSLALMLEAASLSSSGVTGGLRIKGLGAVMAYTSRVWFEDDSEDLSKTMAALDKALSKAEGLAERFEKATDCSPPKWTEGPKAWAKRWTQPPGSQTGSEAEPNDQPQSA